MFDTLQRVDEQLGLCQYRVADCMSLPAQGLTMAQAAVLFNELQSTLKRIERIRDIARTWRVVNDTASLPTIDVE